MAAKKKVETAETLKATEQAPREVSLEEVLGALINAVNSQTALIQELLTRIPPKTKLGPIN